MSIRLLVGNLSAAVNNLRLEQLFAPYGRVTSARIEMDEDSGRSHGCGRVQMGSDADAQRAATALNGHVIDGRPLTVSAAPVPTDELPLPRPRYGNGRSGGGGVRSGRRG